MLHRNAARRAMMLHATAVVRDGAAVLLTGPSGAGKSDMALRLIDRGWGLIADDQVLLEALDGALIASSPERIRGLIEVRGVGIETVEAAAPAPVVLAVALGPETERLPEVAFGTWLGVLVPLLTLDPHPASAPIKLDYAFARARLALRPALR